MKSQCALVLTASALAVACNPDRVAPLNVVGFLVLEPLPGASMTAGYLTLENNSNAPITIQNVTSPQFARVEMHETVLTDDVARMVALAPLVIERRSSIRFEPGARHLMLSGWTQEIVAGLQITVEFHYDDGGLLIVNSTVGPRHNIPD